jgi:hypothetical protein
MEQALFMMNNKFVHEMAAAFVAWTLAISEQSDARLAHAFLHILGRHPTAEEKREALEFIDQLNPDPGVDETGAWSAFVRVLFSGNEFMFVE